MGTMIQRYRLGEEPFKYWPQDARGNNDLLVCHEAPIIQLALSGKF